MRDRIGQLALTLFAAMTVGLFTGCGYVTNGQSILPRLGADVCVNNHTEDQVRVRLINEQGTSQVGSMTVYSHSTRCDDFSDIQDGDLIHGSIDPVGDRGGTPPAFRNILVHSGITLVIRKGGLTPYANSYLSSDQR